MISLKMEICNSFVCEKYIARITRCCRAPPDDGGRWELDDCRTQHALNLQVYTHSVEHNEYENKDDNIAVFRKNMKNQEGETEGKMYKRLSSNAFQSNTSQPVQHSCILLLACLSIVTTAC